MLAINIFKLFHGVLKPSSFYTDSQKKKKKHTILDSQLAFSVNVTSLTEFQPVTDNVTIVSVGKDTYESTFVLIGGSTIHFESYLDAIAFAFKLFKTMNLPFPKECGNVWKFIEIFLFGFESENESQNVATFINDLKNI